MAVSKAVLTTVPGFEDIAAAEVEELIGVRATAAEAGTVTFRASAADLCRICYLSQSASSVLLGNQPILSDLDMREYGIFGNSDDIKGNLAYLMLRAAGYDPARHFLFDPFTRSGAVAIEAALFSSGFPVNYYRKDALSAAFSRLPQFSAADAHKVFSAMDAAAAKRKIRPKILSSSSLMQILRPAEKNAKIAGINKLIRFSRLDIGWLDAKLDERSVDLVVSYPPQFKSGSNQFAAAENKKLGKTYAELFSQARLFMKKSGSVVLLLNGATRAAVSPAAAKRFKHESLRKVKVGNEDFELAKFSQASE